AVLKANLNTVTNDVAVGVLLNFCPAARVTVPFISGDVVILIGDAPVLHLAARSFDEAEGRHPSIRCQRTDQTIVRAFGSLHWAHTAVVRWVNVSNLNASALTGQTTRAQRRQTTLVGQTRQRVVLIHKLRQL